MEFLSEYGLFLAKTVTWVAAILVIIAVVAGLAQKARHRPEEGELEVTRFNDRLKRQKERLESGMMEGHLRKQWRKLKRKEEKSRTRAAKKSRSRDVPEERKPRLFVVDFHGDIRASATESLRRLVTAVLAVADRERGDGLVVRLESGGGLVHSYGLAAAQLDRVREAGLPLTVCVDKVAASGGYMMACVADRILASPFAVLGSIGVMAQIPNVHRLLKRHDIDFEVLTAGEYKRTLTVFGENTEKGRQKFLADLEDTHGLFKDFVARHRPQVAIEEVANGDIWFGERALEVKLTDELKTSDQFLVEAAESSEVLLLRYDYPRSLPQKLGLAVSTALDRTLWRLLQEIRDSRFWS